MDKNDENWLIGLDGVSVCATALAHKASSFVLRSFVEMSSFI